MEKGAGRSALREGPFVNAHQLYNRRIEVHRDVVSHEAGNRGIDGEFNLEYIVDHHHRIGRADRQTGIGFGRSHSNHKNEN